MYLLSVPINEKIGATLVSAGRIQSYTQSPVSLAQGTANLAGSKDNTILLAGLLKLTNQVGRFCHPWTEPG